MTTVTASFEEEFDNDGVFLSFAFDEKTDWRSVPDMLAVEMREFESEWNVRGYDPADLQGQIEMLDQLSEHAAWLSRAVESRASWLRAQHSPVVA